MSDKETYQYVKIKEYILKNIENGKYKDGKIESENFLKLKFHVSRMTVRQAIDVLKQQNILYSVPKKGVYIRTETKINTVYNLYNFMENRDTLKRTTLSKVIFCKKETFTNSLFEELQIKEAWHIIRVRYQDEMPFAYEERYFNCALVNTIPKNKTTTSLHQYLEGDLGFVIAHAQQKITAILSEEIAKYLRIDITSPLLKVQLTTYLYDQRCLEYGTTYYRSDIYSFHQNAYRSKRTM